MTKPEILTLEPGVVTPVPIELIDRDPSQPRVEFEPAALESLSADIKVRGIRKPVELRSGGTGFIIEDGERRWRAAKIAGLTEIPALLAGAHPGDNEDLERLMHQAADSTLRETLTIIDKAHLFKRLVDDYGIKVGDLPEFLQQRGLGTYSRSYVSNIIRMLELPDWAKGAIVAGKMPASAAKSLLSVAEFPEILECIAGWCDDYNPDDEGALREQDVSSWVRHAMEERFPQTNLPYAKNAPYYDVDKHRDELQIKTISVPQEYGDGTVIEYQFITNLEAHERLQAENPKPDPKSPAARAPSAHGKPNTGNSESSKSGKQNKEKAAPESDLLKYLNREKIDAYLIEWWRKYLVEHHARDPRLINAVIHWAAAGAQSNHHGYVTASVQNGLAQAQEKASKEIKRPRLGTILAHDLTDDERATLFDHLLGVMGESAIADLVNHLKLTIEKQYVVDEAYLKLHTRATLAATVKKMGGAELLNGTGKSTTDPDWVSAEKLGQMRTYCLKKAKTWRAEKRVPQDMAKAWKELLKRVKA